MRLEIEKYVKNGLGLSGRVTGCKGNSPERYRSRQKRYFDNRTSDFIGRQAQYSSDFFEVKIQGLNVEKPFEWRTVYARLADIVKPSSSIKRNFDDFKSILVSDPDIDYIPIGAKILAMGNCWLMVNPNNMSGGDGGNGMIQRCNTVWNYLDYYGNLRSEPIIVDKMLANANDMDGQINLNITKGYFNIKAQFNKATAQLNTNSRIILGRNAYYITGYSDFVQEFTGDYDTVRMIEFTARYDEPNAEIDDMERHVAGGKNFSWKIGVSGLPVIEKGDSALFSAVSERNGKETESTERFPVSYRWESSDTDIATVDENGLVTGVSEGNCIIRCVLSQNEEIFTDYFVAVSEATEEEPKVSFLSTVPAEISAYEHVELEAAYFEHGEKTEETVSFEFKNADENAYTVEIDGNKAVIKCWGGSIRPLSVTASCGDYSVTKEIALKGI